MTSKKPIIFLILGIILLMGIACGIFFFFSSMLNQTSDEPTYSLSENENITIDSSTKQIDFLLKLDFIGKNISEVEEEFKNITFISDEKITMNNVQLLNTSGSIDLIIKDDKITNYIFKTKSLYSAEDIVYLFNSLNTELVNLTKDETATIYFYENNSQKPFTSHEGLYDSNNRIEAQYKHKNKTVKIFTQKNDKEYTIVITTA